MKPFSVTACIWVSSFSSLLGIPAGITSTATGLIICAMNAEIEKYNVIIKKKKQKHDKIVMLAKTNLNSKEVCISKALINLNISYDDFFSIGNVLKEHNEMKEEIKHLKTCTFHRRF